MERLGLTLKGGQSALWRHKQGGKRSGYAVRLDLRSRPDRIYRSQQFPQHCPYLEQF